MGRPAARISANYLFEHILGARRRVLVYRRAVLISL